MTVYHCRYAWIDEEVHEDVIVTADEGCITAVQRGPRSADHHALVGLVLPGFANAHSHAFHRALRGRTHGSAGTFWTWRDAMYRVAGALDPDLYLRLARAVYAEMALAGITCVGEFHYLHHQADGVAYHDPNDMAHALRAAARAAGIRLTLLDTCYLAGGLDADGPQPISRAQRRFSDGSAEGWAERVDLLRDDSRTRIGAAIHSVRAVSRPGIQTVADWVRQHGDRPLHAHLSEQPAENAACLTAYGISPTQVFAQAGALGDHATMVHATHLTRDDVELLGSTRTTACLCPTTERDLADGIGPARALLDAGAPLATGSDQHAVIDPLEELRGLEMHERLATGERGRFALAELVGASTVHGHRSLGWSDAGSIAVGRRADLVCIDLDSVRTAGCHPGQAVLAATASDVRTVIIDGAVIVADGHHRSIDTARELSAAIGAIWERVNS